MIQHLCEEFRKKHLNRMMSNSVITKALKLVSSFEIPFSVNNIIGFPFETRELVFDTLTKSTVVGTGFLKYDYLNTNIIKPHMENKSNNHKKIWNIFVLVNWLKRNNLL